MKCLNVFLGSAQSRRTVTARDFDDTVTQSVPGRTCQSLVGHFPKYFFILIDKEKYVGHISVSLSISKVFFDSLF